MTALTEYDRLEAPGIWRPAPDAQRRDVIVSVGDATLILFDMNETALSHWSLPAVLRRNPGRMPALFAPGPDADEELEIADETMVAAIDRVEAAIARNRPQKGRLRLVVLGTAMGAILAVTIFWVPDALVRHTVSVLPDATRTDLGDRLLGQITRVAGDPCDAPSALPALRLLEDRLLDDGRLVVLKGGVTDSAHLPGGIVILNRALIEDFESPEPAAGYILAETLMAEAEDPVASMLAHLGPVSAFRLLTTGTLPDASLKSYAETLLITRRQTPDDEALLDRLESRAIKAAPYAYARDISGETMLPLIEGDRLAPDAARPVVSDGAWVALQGICGG